MENDFSSVPSAIQKEVIVGCLLGDAFMETTTGGDTWRLGIEQGNKQAIYVYKKHELLSSLSEKMEKPRPKGGKSTNITFWTPRLPLLKVYGDAFYQRIPDSFPVKFVKVVPKQIEEWLTPRGLAFWYMDDGSIKSKEHKLVYLNTQAYTVEECDFLCKILINKFKLKAQVKSKFDKRTKKSYPQIALHGDTLERFRELIEPCMYPEVKALPKPRGFRGKGKKTLEAEQTINNK